jgi:uncharacterized protein (TIGR02231 family)
MNKILLCLALLISQAIAAQQKDSVFTQAKLTNATVYYGYGAELQHTSKASLVNGMQQVIISDVSLYPDINSLQVSCPENVTILSYYHRIYTKPVELPVLPPSKSNDTIKSLQKIVSGILNEYNIQEDVLRRISGLIENNFTTPDKKNISSAELIKLTDYYTAQVKSIKQKLYDLYLRRIENEEKIAEITRRLSSSVIPNQPAEEAKPTGQLIMQVMSKGSATIDIDLSYFTRNAGWVPLYDIRVKTIDNSLKLVYKALVSQTTGLNWKGVKLNLSTSNPNQGTTVPSLFPVFVQLYAPVLYDNLKELKYSPNTNNPALSEVVVTALSKNDNANNRNNNFSDVSDFTLLKESQLNTNFEIDLPYDIPSDGNAYSVNIKEEKIPATYQHFAIPKVDKDAFLLARLSRWDTLSLLPGQANIIMDNVYLGKSYLDPNTTADTLSLSLGRDKRIAIARKLIKEFKKTSKGDTKTELFTYEILIKNNKKQPLAMSLKDQYPVSKTKEVEVTLIEEGGAVVNAENGSLTWEVILQPGESRKIRFSYQVKYPKDKILQETR